MPSTRWVLVLITGEPEFPAKESRLARKNQNLLNIYVKKCFFSSSLQFCFLPLLAILRGSPEGCPITARVEEGFNESTRLNARGVRPVTGLSNWTREKSLIFLLL